MCNTVISYRKQNYYNNLFNQSIGCINKFKFLIAVFDKNSTMSYIYYCRCEIIHVRNLKIIYIKKLLDICHSEYNKEAVDTK